MENIHSNIQGDNMETSNIQQLFQSFIVNGGEPKVTSFKRHLDQLINQEIKPLCGRSGKTATGDDWRSEVKSRFSGRGAKWVKVSLEEISSTLEGFDLADCIDYRHWIDQAGYAWIRFAGPRVANGVKSAAFEVRTGGSTIDHPKQLHYIALHDLDDKIEQLPATPHAMRLELATTRNVEVEVSSDEVVEVKESYEDMMGDIDDLMDVEDDLNF
tara:strand:+ start:1398 stop:2039 length:642 start_codon:yes stop_codon:yes gene_type:complete